MRNLEIGFALESPMLDRVEQVHVVESTLQFSVIHAPEIVTIL